MANGMRSGQAGAMKLGGMISLLAFLAFCYALYNIAPLYYADFNLGDKMVEVCRLHPGTNPEDRLRDALMVFVREQGLDSYVSRQDFKFQLRENRRRITLEYQRKAKVLPGWERTFRFNHDVEQPFF